MKLTPTGLPREAPCPAYDCNYTSELMWPRIANLSLIFPPNTMPIYSNLGFAILGRILEEIAGIQWEDYVQQFIVERLGLTNTGDSHCTF